MASGRAMRCAQRVENGGGGALVGGEEICDGFGVELGRGGIGAEIGKIPAGFEEVLVAGGALLAVPALLVDQHDGGQQAQPLDGKGDVGQVGDGAVAVLKIKGVEELLGALGADLGERLAHGERGAGVLGHGVGQDLGVGAVDGEDIGLVAGAGGQKRFTGHWCGLANRIRHWGRIGAVHPNRSGVHAGRTIQTSAARSKRAMQEYSDYAHRTAAATASGPLGDDAALERPAVCALAGSGLVDWRRCCPRACRSTRFRVRRGWAWCRSGWTGSRFAACRRFPGRAAFPN